MREWLLYLRSPTVVNRVLVFCWPYLWRVQPVLILVCVFLAHCAVNTNVHTSCQKLLSTTQEVLIYHILRFKSTTVYLNISCNVVWELQCPSTTEETINMFGSFNDFSVFLLFCQIPCTKLRCESDGLVWFHCVDILLLGPAWELLATLTCRH